ncbi:response regulator transcription factor [Sphingobacterium multivorum]|jgi:DNA-binding NarL/FixJ family response regulator|uniref:response regulator transcription factor n=1 Tax=Sphingobacterium multivorum TaxID=28454 RepID=UPI00289A851C|nr:response regulator transcription factor [Sphingobacterium multivorum]MDF2851412.1 DNA-binding response regulator [Sphingobacterium multivorum]
MKTTILIADDHPIFLKGLQEVIESEPAYEVIYAAKNGMEALAIARTQLPMVTILDIDMPEMNGLAASEELIKLIPDANIILLTMHKAKDTFLRALEIGVAGYVLKENAVVDIIQAIEAVTNGNSYISPEMSSFLLSQRRTNRNPTTEDLLSTLTPSELKILKLVGSYKSTKAIADELFISEKTVSNHRMNILRKLNLTGKNSLLRFAIEQR